MGWQWGHWTKKVLTTTLMFSASEYFQESIRQEIRMARERFSGAALSEELSRIQMRLDSVELLTPDIVMNLLLSYRDIQVTWTLGWDAMCSFYDIC